MKLYLSAMVVISAFYLCPSLASTQINAKEILFRKSAPLSNAGFYFAQILETTGESKLKIKYFNGNEFVEETVDQTSVEFPQNEASGFHSGDVTRLQNHPTFDDYTVFVRMVTQKHACVIYKWMYQHTLANEITSNESCDVIDLNQLKPIQRFHGGFTIGDNEWLSFTNKEFDTEFNNRGFLTCSSELFDRQSITYYIPSERVYENAKCLVYSQLNSKFFPSKAKLISFIGDQVFIEITAYDAKDNYTRYIYSDWVSVSSLVKPSMWLWGRD